MAVDWENSSRHYSFGSLSIRQQGVQRLGFLDSPTHLRPLRCGFQICEDGHVNDPFVTEQYALVYVLSGKGFYMDQKHGKLPVEPGCFVQRLPKVTHSLRLDGYSASFFVAIPAEALSLLQLTNSLASDQPVMKVGILPFIVKDYLKMIDSLRTKPEEELMHVLIQMQQMVLNFHKISRKIISPSNSIIDDAINILNANLEEKILIPALAKQLNISYSSFRKQFIKQTSYSPGDFRISKRIELSQQFLLDGKSIKEVASKLNFADAYTFSRQFKKVCGIPPSLFVKMNSQSG
jgi:AraC family transcriptional regulator, arabinose operon regulatory protein